MFPLIEEVSPTIVIPYMAVWIYLGLVNALAFFFIAFDKYFAVSGARRVRERTLWLLTLIGGTFGALVAMNLFRHKTKKASFQAMMLLIIAIQAGLLVWFVGRE